MDDRVTIVTIAIAVVFMAIFVVVLVARGASGHFLIKVKDWLVIVGRWTIPNRSIPPRSSRPFLLVVLLVPVGLAIGLGVAWLWQVL